jgi:acetyltransferase-like isoleucine patch superfamily enzyme
MHKIILKKIKTFILAIHWRIKYRALFFAQKIQIQTKSIIISKFSRVYGNLIVLQNASLFIDKVVNIDKYSFIEAIGEHASIKLCSNVVIGPYSCLGTELKIEIGKGTTTSRFFNCVGHVYIGEGVLIGPNVFISSGKHIINGKNTIRTEDNLYIEKYGKPFSDQVIIGDNCWIGANCVILPGVNLGNGCVVGANSVVTKSFPDNVIIGGVPAKIIKQR